MSTNQTFKYKQCFEAAKAGDINELKKMHENGCNWGYVTAANAAFFGHLDCLKYAQENGWKWNKWIPYMQLKTPVAALRLVD